VGDLPWTLNVFPDAKLSPGKAYVTVHDVLLAIYYHLRAAVKGAEYEAMTKSRKAEIFREFERRVGADIVQRGKGLRRIDLLNGHSCARGLVSTHPKGNVWDVVICQLTSDSEAPASGPAYHSSSLPLQPSEPDSNQGLKLKGSRPAQVGDDPAKLFDGFRIQKLQAEHHDAGTDSPKDDTVSEAPKTRLAL